MGQLLNIYPSGLAYFILMVVGVRTDYSLSEIHMDLSASAWISRSKAHLIRLERKKLVHQPSIIIAYSARSMQ